MNLYKDLIDKLSTLGSVCVAFSGGVDSAFLLKVCKEVLGDKVLAVTVTSSMCPQRELKEAVAFARQLGVKHVLLEANEYSIPEFVKNERERCYYCKKVIFSKIKETANEMGIQSIIDGSNADDSLDYRPGMKALQELGIISPLKQVGLTKKEIRELSKVLNLSTWNKPSMACLASRIPYGQTITKDKLIKIELAEEFLLQKGFQQFRVRYYDNLAKIEVLPEEIGKLMAQSTEIIAHFKEIGFIYITLDMEGYRTGSMNEILGESERGMSYG